MKVRGKLLPLAISLLTVLSTSLVAIDQSSAALRACTGKEIATAYSYKAQIEVEKFYSSTTNTANLASLNMKLQNLYASCNTDGFKAGAPSSKAPQCTTADINLLSNFRSAYAQQVNAELDNSDEIGRLRNLYNNYISTGKSQLAQEASLKISKLSKEIQHHYLMQVYYKMGFEALSTTCRNSGVSLPKRELDNPSPSYSDGGTPTLSNHLQRFMGYRNGDLLPKSITGIECGSSSKGEVFTRTRNSNGEWVTISTAWSGKYDLGGKYAVQTATIPVNPIYINLSSGEWQGIVWPYTTQRVFAVERCDSGNSKKNAIKSYVLSDLAGKKSNWARQAISNANPLTYDGSTNYYRLDDIGAQDLTAPEWSCKVKKPVTTTVKKNGKSTKVTTPAVSDFKVNISSDGNEITLWECDDLKLGQFVQVQKILLSNSWDISVRDASNNFLWVAAMSDPKYVNWTWACPDVKGERTCRPVSSLS